MIYGNIHFDRPNSFCSALLSDYTYGLLHRQVKSSIIHAWCDVHNANVRRKTPYDRLLIVQPFFSLFSHFSVIPIWIDWPLCALHLNCGHTTSIAKVREPRSWTYVNVIILLPIRSLFRKSGVHEMYARLTSHKCIKFMHSCATLSLINQPTVSQLAQ
jgi:hypothetical protein